MHILRIAIIFAPMCIFALDEYTLTEKTLLHCISETSIQQRMALMHTYFDTLRRNHGFDERDVHFTIAPTPPGTSGQSLLKNEDLVLEGYMPTHIMLNPQTLFGLSLESRRRSCINAMYTIHHELGHAAQFNRMKRAYDMLPPQESHTISEHNVKAAIQMIKNRDGSQLDNYLSYPHQREQGSSSVEKDADRYACNTIETPCLLQKAFEYGYISNRTDNTYLDDATQRKIVADRCMQNAHRETVYRKPFWGMHTSRPAL